jgi:Integrin beta chain VWA domain
VFLSDRSQSFQAYAASEKQFTHNLMGRLQQSQLDVRYGVGSFVDIPAYPFGFNRETTTIYHPEERVPAYWQSNNGDQNWNGTGYTAQYFPERVIPAYEETWNNDVGSSYIYSPSLTLTHDTTQVESTLNGMDFFTQADSPEAQLMALQAMAQDTSLGFRNNATRVVVMMTDSPYHVSGDVSAAGVNLTYDYPDIAQVRSALQQSNILPIFAVTSNVVGEYRSLAAQLGFDHRIVFDLGSIANNPAQLADQIAATSRDLIGIVQQGDGLNLNGAYFSYVG